MLSERLPTLVNIGPEDLAEGNIHLILALTWELILKYEHGLRGPHEGGLPTIQGGARALEGTPALVAWMRDTCRVAPYALELPKSVHLLPGSLSDGRALCALVHAYQPDALNYASAMTTPPDQRLALAFEVGAQLGVPLLLDAEDVLHQRVDPQSIMTYLAKLRTGLTTKRRLSATARAAANSELGVLGLVVKTTRPVFERTSSAVTAIKTQAAWLMSRESSMLRRDRTSRASQHAPGSPASRRASHGPLATSGSFRVASSPSFARHSPPKSPRSPGQSPSFSFAPKSPSKAAQETAPAPAPSPTPMASGYTLLALAAVVASSAAAYPFLAAWLAAQREAAARAAEVERAAREAAAARGTLGDDLMTLLCLLGALVGAYYYLRRRLGGGGGEEAGAEAANDVSWERRASQRMRLKRANTQYPNGGG